MKKKIRIILGIGLTLVLTVTLAIGLAAPVPAADYPEDEWGTWGLPCLEWDTDVGPMAVAPDGTLYAAVRYYDDDEEDYCWKVMKSEDGGFSWDDTQLCALLSPDFVDNMIVSIVVSTNYEEDETIYVATFGGTIYRLEEAGDNDVIALRTITGVDELYSIDVWSDGDDCWILAGTDIGVWEIRDAPFRDWTDYQLPDAGYEVAYSPDFDDHELMWVISESGGDFLITSTVSPGQWGQVIGEVEINIEATEDCDLDFPDDYSSSDPDTGDTILFAGLSSPDGGDVYLIEGIDADDGDSNAIALMDLAGDIPTRELGEPAFNIVSLAVSGDYADAVILAGEPNCPIVWISDDGGDDWGDADKNPTGESNTLVYMEADVVWGGAVFTFEENISFVSTVGAESAVSRSDPNEDGDLVYNQVGNINTTIDEIVDLGFHPEFDDNTTYLMLTYSDPAADGYDTASLWLTENGDEEEPDYIRILCGANSAPGNLDADASELRLVDWSLDGEAIYLNGEDDDGDECTWKSTDDGQTFGKKRPVRNDVEINDWVIYEHGTIYAAADNDGFYMTWNSGLSWSTSDVGSAMNSIALQPGFDPDDEDMDAILLGSASGGDVFVSTNGGDTWKDTNADEKLSGTVFVAFDADYADEDADGYMHIYACGGGDVIHVGEVFDTDDVDWEYLLDNTNDGAVDIDCEGLVVSEDNVLYAIFDSGGAYVDEDDVVILDEDDNPVLEPEDLVRLRLHMGDSLWESVSDDDLVDPDNHQLWLTPGSTFSSIVVWTLDNDISDDNECEVWVMEDTVSGIGGIEDFAIQSMLIDFDRQPNKDEIVIGKAVFSLPEGASYDLDVDDVTIIVDGVVITIPAGSFIGAKNKEKYVFTSTEGVEPSMHMKLDFNKGEWSLKVSKIDASAIDNHDGVDVTFAIGSLSAREKLDMWVERLSYTAES